MTFKTEHVTSFSSSRFIVVSFKQLAWSHACLVMCLFTFVVEGTLITELSIYLLLYNTLVITHIFLVFFWYDFNLLYSICVAKIPSK